MKYILNEAEIGVSRFGALSTNNDSSSKIKFNNNVPIDEIIKTTGWSNDCTFPKYYDKSIIIIMMDINQKAFTDLFYYF